MSLFTSLHKVANVALHHKKIVGSLPSLYGKRNTSYSLSKFEVPTSTVLGSSYSSLIPNLTNNKTNFFTNIRNKWKQTTFVRASSTSSCCGPSVISFVYLFKLLTTMHKIIIRHYL